MFLKQLAYLACSFFSFYELFFYQKTYKHNTTILYEQCQSEAICFANILHVLCNLKSILLIDELHSPLMQLTYTYVFFLNIIIVENI